MAGIIAVKSVRKGWNGDIRRNRVVFTCSSATADTVTPNVVGLHKIYSIKPTGRIGAFDGQTLVACGSITWNATGDVIICYPGNGAALSAGDIEADFYGI